MAAVCYAVSRVARSDVVHHDKPFHLRVCAEITSVSATFAPAYVTFSTRARCLSLACWVSVLRFERKKLCHSPEFDVRRAGNSILRSHLSKLGKTRVFSGASSI